MDSVSRNACRGKFTGRECGGYRYWYLCNIDKKPILWYNPSQRVRNVTVCMLAWSSGLRKPGQPRRPGGQALRRWAGEFD